MKTRNVMFLLVAVSMLMAASAGADIYVEKASKAIGNTGGDGTQEWVTRMWISENRIRVEEPEGNMVNITDFNARTLTTLDVENNEYFVISLDQVQQDFIRSTAQLKDRIDMNWRVEAVQDGGVIAGYPTQLIRFHGLGTMSAGNGTNELRITMSIWVSDQVPGMTAVSDRILEVMGLDKNPFIGTAVLDEIKRLGGFHLKAVIESEMDGKVQGVEQSVLLLEEIEDDPTRFEIPSGFAEVSAPTTR